MKKAVNFGFLDFSTLEKRRFFCEKELELNRRLCPDMYLEVVPINESNVVKIKGEGEPVEYAVKMKRLPQDKILSKLLEENKVDNTLIDRIAKIITDFHAKAETNQRISEFGALKIIKTNWDENIDQTKEYIGKTISAKDFGTIRESVEKFMAENSTVFEKRIEEDKVKDCHGDIHSGNIFAADKVYIFDAIEFNERFRYSDVAADVAFLAMDLDFRGRHDLSDFFVEKYINYSGDRELTKLLTFYECYRAYVRGKVVGFRLKDPNITDHEKLVAINEAEAYFELATVYAKML
jgi:aminoglycoside phosphotransferase family enzyme